MTTDLQTQREQLAHIRRLNAEPPPFRPPAQLKHQKLPSIFLREGLLLDPDRPVRDFWKTTIYDQNGGNIMVHLLVNKDGEEVIDAGDGEGVSLNDGGPFKVRVLSPRSTSKRGVRTITGVGAVIEMDAVHYILARGSCRGNNNPPYEPVPDDTPLGPALLPDNFPSTMDLARSRAALGLAKPADKLSVKQVVDYFQKLPAINAEVLC